MMTNGDPEGRIFLSFPHTNTGLFFVLTTVFIYLFSDKFPEVPKTLNKVTTDPWAIFFPQKLNFLQTLKFCHIAYYKRNRRKIEEIYRLVLKL